MYNSLEDKKKMEIEAEFKKQEKQYEIEQHNKKVLKSDHKLKYFGLIVFNIVIIAFGIFLYYLNQVFEFEPWVTYYQLVFFGLTLIVIRIFLPFFADAGSGGVFMIGIIIVLGTLTINPEGIAYGMKDFFDIPTGIGVLYVGIGIWVLVIPLVIYPAVKFLLKGPKLPDEEPLS